MTSGISASLVEPGGVSDLRSLFQPFPVKGIGSSGRHAVAWLVHERFALPEEAIIKLSRGESNP